MEKNKSKTHKNKENKIIGMRDNVYEAIIQNTVATTNSNSQQMNQK